MNEETSSTREDIRTRKLGHATVRSGMAKDQLIFVIICSAAIGVAVVAMAFSLFSGGSRGKIRPSQWQCLDCSADFSKKTRERSPIECEECGGQAVRVNRRKCPACGKEVLVSRMRLTEQGKAQYKAAQESSGGAPMLPMGPGMDFQSEIQFWIPQPDGSYGWSQWMAAGPGMGSAFSSLTCSECGAPLYENNRRR